MADNTISPVVPNVSGGRNVSTGQKAVTQTAAQSGIDFKSYLGGRTAVQDNSTTFLKRRNSYTLNKNNTKFILRYIEVISYFFNYLRRYIICDFFNFAFCRAVF